MLYVEVENTTTTCTNQTPVSFTVNPLPAANDLSKSLNETTANSGVAEDVDLNQYNTEVNANAEDAGYSVVWYTETSPGSGEKDVIVNVVDIEDGDRFIAEVNDPNNCTNEAIATFEINTIPDIQDPQPEYCEDTYNSGEALADLNEIENSYGLTGVTYTWYEDSGLTTELANQEEQIVNSSTIFHLKVEDDSNPNIFNSTEVTFTVDPMPEALTQSKTYCEDVLGSSSAEVNLTDIHPEINTETGNFSFEWFTTSDLDPGNQINSGDLSTYSVSDGTTLYVKVINDDTGCENNTSIDFTIVSQPQVSIASANYEICETDIFEVANISADITIEDESSFEWSVVTGTESMVDATTLNATYTPSATDISNGSVTLRLTAFGNANCASVSEDITVNITLAPIADAGDDLTICEGDVIDFSSLTTQPSVQNEASIQWFTSGPTSGTAGTFGNDTELLTTYTPSQDEINEGSVLLTLRANGEGSCDFVESSINVTINPEPTVTTIADFSICETDEINISGDFGGSVNAAEWQIVNGNGTITSESTSGSTVSAIYEADPSDIGGNVTLKLISTDQDAPCGVVEDQLIIQLKEAPIAIAPADFEICENENINLSGTLDGSATNGEWRVVTGSGTISGSNVNYPEVTATYTPGPNDFGTVVDFELIAFDPESETFCSDSTDTVAVNIRTLPIVDAGSDEEICEYDEYYFADANILADAQNFSSIEWTTSGDGTFDSTSTGLSRLHPKYTPGANDISNGTVTLSITGQANHPTICSEVSSDMNLTIKPQPTINAVSDKILCPDETQAEINLSADLTGGTFTWEITNNDQLGLASSGNGNIPSFTAQPNTTGASITSMVTIDYELDGCIADQDTFEIVTKPTPVTDQLDDIEFCAGDNIDINFSANTTGETFSWSVDDTSIATTLNSSGTGDLSFAAASNDSGSPKVAEFTYYATLNGCVSETKTFTATLLPTPVIDPITDIEVCSFDNITTNFNTNVTGVSYSWDNDNTATGIPASGSGNLDFSASENLTGTNEVSNITLTATKDGCISAQESFQVIVKPKPIIVTQNDIEICPGDEIASIPFSDNSNGNSTITWTATNPSNVGLPSSSGTSALPAFTAATNNGTSSRSSTITVTSTWDNCVSDQMTFVIELKPNPIMDPIPDQAVCAEDVISTAFSNSLGAGTTYNWTNDNTNIGLGSNGTGDFSFTLPENKTGSAIIANITVTPENNGCFGPSETFTITLNPTPVISDLEDIEVCSEEFISIPVSTDLTDVNFSVTSSDNNLFTDPPVVVNGNIEFTTAINTTGADLFSDLTLTAEKDNCENQEVFQVVLKNRPVVSSEPDEAPLCAGDVVASRNFSHEVGSGTFSWEITQTDLIGDGTATSGSGDFPGFTLAENNTGLPIEGYVKYLSTSNGCESVTDSFKITLKPTPITQNEDIIFCEGDFVNIEFLSNVDDTQLYEWTIDNLTIGINNSSGSTDQFITPAGFTAVNNSDTDDNVANISVFSTANDCQGPIQTFEVRVKPIPTFTNDNFNLETCSNENFTFIPTSNISTTEFDWTLVSADESAISGIVESGTDTLTLDLINTSSEYQEIIYEITPSNQGCVGESELLTISLAPEIAFETIESEYVVCSGEDFTLPITVKNNLNDISYSWTVSDNDSGAKDSTASVVGGNLTNSVSGQRDTVIYTITPFLDDSNCAGESEEVRIVINPDAVVEIEPVNDICEGENLIVEASLLNGASSGSWSGGNGQFTSLTSTQTTYIPDESEYGEEVTLRFTANDPDQGGPCPTSYDEVTFAIDLLPTVSILGDPFPGNLYCVENDRIELNGSPDGGVFSGRGVELEDGQYYFNPVLATVGGPYTITYEYINENNCSNSVEAIVEVTNGPESDFTSIADDNDGYFCSNSSFKLEPEEEGGDFSGPGIEVRQGESFFNAQAPDVVDLDTVEITYTIFEDETSCEAFTTKTFIRIPEPEIDLDYQNVCDLNNTVDLEIIGFYDTTRDSLVSFEIEYNDEVETTDASGIARLEFESPGIKTLTITAFTDLGCPFEREFDIDVGNIQEVDFTVSNLKTSSPGEDGTQFIDESTLDVIANDPSINSIISYHWDFGVEEIETDTSSSENPTFNYEEAGAYEVTLVIETSLNCFDSISKVINLVPAINTYPYIETFDNSSGGWYTAANNDIPSSWIHDYPNGAFEGKNDNPTPEKIWKTAAYPDSLPSGYLEDENSYLVGPTFDLTSLEKPMIAFDMWLDVQSENFEGAILEYSTNGEDWSVFGEVENELNWYNLNISIPIGGEESNRFNYAWNFADENRNWTRVAHIINDSLINDLSNVTFRINFKGDRFSGNPDGMAVDNFYVGERQKLVLLENFTNLNSNDYSAKRGQVQNLIDSEIGKDILSLNFHISSPTPDSINSRNSIELDSRATTYSIEKSSQLIIDGDQFDSDVINSDGSLTDDFKTVITRQSLLEPNKLIELRIDETADEHTIRFDAIRNANEAKSEDLVVYFFIIEKTIDNSDQLKNIVRKILPNINGLDLISLEEGFNMSYEWEVNSIYTNHNLAIATVIQNQTSNEILEVNLTDINNAKYPKNILSVKENSTPLNMDIFPNPSRGKINISFSKRLDDNVELMVFDTKGAMVKQMTIKAGSKTEEIDLNTFSSGVYHIITKDENGNLNRKKVIILD
ncbi:MAG: PKD-like domain-containing protein [Bacteroidota bacterium]